MIMGQIRDIMEKNVITIEKDNTAQDAAKIIAEKDISFLVVMNNGLPEGVLSESDFVRKIAVEGRKSGDVPISEIMSYKFRSAGPTTTIEDAVQKMLQESWFNVTKGGQKVCFTDDLLFHKNFGPNVDNNSWGIRVISWKFIDF